MFKLTIRSLFAHKARLLLTLVAVTLGVAFVSTSFVLADSLTSFFEEISEEVGGPIDASVRDEDWAPQSIDVPPVDLAVLDDLRAVPEVAQASASVVTPVFVVDAEGNDVGETPGPPNLAYPLGDGDVGPSLLLDGALPDNGEVVVDIDTVAELDLEIGDSLTISSFLAPPDEYEVVGIGSFGEDNASGPKYFWFDLATMQTLVGFGPDQAQQFDLAAAEGVSSEELVAAIQPLLGEGLDALTQEEVIDEFAAGFTTIINIFTGILLGFAGVALFVSIFVIANTFAIVLGQRIRELGLLRAVGARSAQVTGSVVTEALLIGVMAWLLGVGLSLAISGSLLNFIGGDEGVPLQIAPRTIIITGVVGVLITLIAAVAPAIRAGRIPPMAALRSDSSLQPEKSMLQRAFGALMLLVGVVLFLVGLITRPDSTVTFIGLLAVGALCSIIGTAALGPLFAAPAARLLGSKSSAYVVLGVGAALIVLAGWLAVSQAGSILSGGEALDELREQMTPADGAPPSDSELKASTIGAGVVGLVLAALGVIGLSRPLARLRSDHPDRNRWFHQLGRGAFSAVMTVLVIGGIFSTFGAFGLAVPALAAGAALILGGQAGRSLAGQIAQGNAMRSPRRTATTAAALMIGLSLITSVTVVTESIRSALSGTFENSVSADYFVTDAEFTGFSPEVANRLEAVDGVTGVARLSEVSFDVTFEGAADPSDVGGLSAPTDLGDFLDVGVTEGSLADLTGDSVVILADVAEENGIEVGDVVPAVWDITDDEVDLEVVGLFDDESVLGTSWVVSSEAALAHGLPSQRRDGFVTFNVDPAVDGEALRAELQALVDEFPRLDLADKDEFAANQEGFLDQALRVLQVFLGLAVVIALIGIANTMALSVFERTRELGLIRAVGGTTHQVRQMIRWEAVIVSLFGGVLGATLGTVFGFVMVTALPDSIVTSFVFPWTDIAVYLVVAAVAGLAAAYFPARRAGRLDILEAISHD